MQEIDAEFIKIKKEKVDLDVPTYEARLMLQSSNFQKMKKVVDLPFTTREKNGRQLKEYSTISHNRYETKTKNQLTTHSGRFSKDLKEDLRLKEEEIKRKKEKPKKTTESRIIKLENISEIKVGGMDWIIQEDETDQMFMKDYKLRDVVGGLKKRVG